MENEKTKFQLAYELNVNEKTEAKNGLTYLSWAWAWAEFKKIYQDAEFKVIKDEKGLPYIYDENLGYMVFTEVTAGMTTHEMWLPVMDGANKSMKAFKYKYTTKYGEKEVEQATMFDINKTIMRCLTKNLAMFGLGLYIYAGEDLPENEVNDTTPTIAPRATQAPVSVPKPKDDKLAIKKEIIRLCDNLDTTLSENGKYKEFVRDTCGVELEEKNFEFVIKSLKELN